MHSRKEAREGEGTAEAAQAGADRCEEGSSRSDRTGNVFVVVAVALLVFVSAATAVTWHRWARMSAEASGHASAVEDFVRARGIPSVARGSGPQDVDRTHLEPPAVRVSGYCLTFVGLRPDTFASHIAWVFLVGCLVSTWLWLRCVAGSRAAMLSVALLAGPLSFFTWQVDHIGFGAVLTIAPLAFWALARRKYVACSVLAFVALASDPAGLMVPVGLLTNSWLAPRDRLKGTAAVLLAALFYMPWQLHLAAHGGILPSGLKMTGPSAEFAVSLFAGASAVVGAVILFFRRGRALSIVGAVTSLAAAIPLGLAGFPAMHWALACMGGYGLSQALSVLDGKRLSREVGRVAAVAAVFTVVVFAPSVGYGPSETDESLHSRGAAGAMPRLVDFERDTAAAAETEPDATGREAGVGRRPLLRLPRIAMLVVMLMGLVLLDLLPVPWPAVHLVAVILNALVIAVCLLPILLRAIVVAVG